MKLAPIVLFVYNRPSHTGQTVEALKKNTLAGESDLFIFADGPKKETDRGKVKKVRKYIRTVDGFKKITIIERKKNFGLAESIIKGVTEVTNKHGKVIVLEDDLLTSRYFLRFMNDALNYYQDEETVGSIHGYVYPIKNTLPETFFLRDPGCLGWATWQRAWRLFNNNGDSLLKELVRKKLTAQFDYGNSYPFTEMLNKQADGRIDSWAIKWYASLFLKNKLTLYPGKSLVFHNGNDGSGTHGGVSDDYAVQLSARQIKISDILLVENKTVLLEYIRYFESIKPSYLFKTIKKMASNLNAFCRRIT